MPDGGGGVGTPLRNSLWNLLYRIVSLNDHSRTAWGAILRGACRAFFKERHYAFFRIRLLATKINGTRINFMCFHWVICA